MNGALVKRERRYTYQDYLAWPEDERWEIIDGEAYDLAPDPTIRHQRIVKNVIRCLERELVGREIPCEGFIAPIDVILDEHNIVQPDVFIVCDKDIVKEKFIEGAPDIIFEIVSKTSAYKDTNIKYNLYKRYGVKEYILIFPELEIVQRYFLENGEYIGPQTYNWDQALRLKSIHVEIPLWEVLEKEVP